MTSEAESRAYEAFWAAWEASHSPYQSPAAQPSFSAGFLAGLAAERERTAPKSWTQVYETTDSPAEDGIWRAIHERIGWGYSGVSGAREMEANEDIRRAIAAIRADERERTAALVAAAREVGAGLRMPSEEGFLKLAALDAALRAYEEGPKGEANG